MDKCLVLDHVIPNGAATFHPVLRPTGFQFLYNTSFEDGWGWMVGGCLSVAVTEQQHLGYGSMKVEEMNFGDLRGDPLSCPVYQNMFL